jgi:uncharacterized protein YndB with AHSA1/START domain
MKGSDINEPTVTHDTIVLERTFAAPPARVFAAWADPDSRSQWAVPSGEWETAEDQSDFRVGGREVSRFGPPGDARYRAETNYLNIVPDRRIIMAGTMAELDTPISASMATVEFLSAGAGTRMIYTEQAAFLDGRDKPDYRRKGWETNMTQLEAYLRDGAAK